MATDSPPIITTLQQAFPNAISSPGSPLYEQENSKFWNQDNASVRPSAIITPSSPQETASILHLLSTSKTPFAIRSGGYMPVPAYNTSPSLLLSTTNLDGIELTANNTVRFGAGLQWGTVYDFLEPRGLVVPGGRARPVGVAGFLLHGGVSHFYAELGWACESVVEFEVALADGRVVSARSGHNEDLYWALKGGGKNFGVVTAFEMRTRRLPKMWGGVRVALGREDIARRVFEGVHGLHDERGGGESEKAHVEIISFYNPVACVGGDPMFALALAYAGEVERPEVLRGFWEVEAVADMTRVTTQRDLGDDEKNFVGYDKRGLFRTFSYRGSPELSLEIYKEYYAAVKESGMHDLDPTAIAGLLWAPSAKKLASGTSVLSLGEEAEPYVWGNVVFRWEKSEASKKMHAIADGITETLKNKLRDAGAFVPFTYANVAGVDDMTFAGLPEQTRQKLWDVAAKYDPEGVFQKQVTGFKLE